MFQSDTDINLNIVYLITPLHAKEITAREPAWDQPRPSACYIACVHKAPSSEIGTCSSLLAAFREIDPHTGSPCLPLMQREKLGPDAT